MLWYKHGAELYITDWLSHHNHTENKDQKNSDMNISLHMVNMTVDIPICTSIEDIKAVTDKDVELQMLKAHIIKGWSHTKEGLQPGVEKYWLITHEHKMTDCIVMKGK